MENIEIKKNKNKRSIESLIEDSAIDSSYHFEVIQLRKAFNQTLMNMNAKNTQRQREVQKLKILLRQSQEKRIRGEKKMQQLKEQYNGKSRDLQLLTQQYKQIKSRLKYLEYKLNNINENRNQILPQTDDQIQQKKEDLKKKLKNQIYSQFGRIIIRKVDCFTSDIKKIPMSRDLEKRIEEFLQELVYMNPYSGIQIVEQIKKQKKQSMYGKIKKGQFPQKQQTQKQWRMLQKSLQKLKELNRGRNTISPQNKKINEANRQVSRNKYRRRQIFQN